MKCKNCKYFLDSVKTDVVPVGEGMGTCHRYPPIPDMNEYCIENCVRPIVWDDGWCGEFQQGDPDILSMPISYMAFSVRIEKVFHKMGIKTVKDLISKKPLELFGFKNFGMTSLREVNRKLEYHNLTLMPEKLNQ